ncbi:helix-turn-helix transcriptional regulator [Primorskyibacter sp. 2E233]|uniref:helix-turn-helix transcriptional regulator n=1 Tax=Primorskyibacter sp. 2E233 TaxID=3413431 RepID=UPI003BF25B22
MFEEFILDLKSMRKKSGLSQEDCGHLIGSTHNIIGRIERGERKPTVEEICALQLLFARSFDSLYGECLGKARVTLADNLRTLPEPQDDGAFIGARNAFLKRLEVRLKDSSSDHDA